MFTKILVIVAALIALVFIYAATKPDNFRVQRSVIINAPAEKIFAVVNDLHRWDEWSPYTRMDPAMKVTHSGAASGKGAVYEWQGNNKAGVGRMEIIESTPTSLVRVKLDFLKPFEGHNTAEFTLVPNGDSTAVSWTLFGPSPYISKLMSVFFNMDKMIGSQFEEGLANLKTLNEKQN